MAVLAGAVAVMQVELINLCRQKNSFGCAGAVLIASAKSEACSRALWLPAFASTAKLEIIISLDVSYEANLLD